MVAAFWQDDRARSALVHGPNARQWAVGAFHEPRLVHGPNVRPWAVEAFHEPVSFDEIAGHPVHSGRLGAGQQSARLGFQHSQESVGG